MSTKSTKRTSYEFKVEGILTRSRASFDVILTRSGKRRKNLPPARPPKAKKLKKSTTRNKKCASKQSQAPSTFSQNSPTVSEELAASCSDTCSLRSSEVNEGTSSSGIFFPGSPSSDSDYEPNHFVNPSSPNYDLWISPPSSIDLNVQTSDTEEANDVSSGANDVVSTDASLDTQVSKQFSNVSLGNSEQIGIRVTSSDGTGKKMDDVHDISPNLATGNSCQGTKKGQLNVASATHKESDRLADGNTNKTEQQVCDPMEVTSKIHPSLTTESVLKHRNASDAGKTNGVTRPFSMFDINKRLANNANPRSSFSSLLHAVELELKNLSKISTEQPKFVSMSDGVRKSVPADGPPEPQVPAKVIDETSSVTVPGATSASVDGPTSDTTSGETKQAELPNMKESSLVSAENVKKVPSLPTREVKSREGTMQLINATAEASPGKQEQLSDVPNCKLTGVSGDISYNVETGQQEELRGVPNAETDKPSVTSSVKEICDAVVDSTPVADETVAVPQSVESRHCSGSVSEESTSGESNETTEAVLKTADDVTRSSSISSSSSGQHTDELSAPESPGEGVFVADFTPRPTRSTEPEKHLVDMRNHESGPNVIDAKKDVTTSLLTESVDTANILSKTVPSLDSNPTTEESTLAGADLEINKTSNHTKSRQPKPDMIICSSPMNAVAKNMEDTDEANVRQAAEVSSLSPNTRQELNSRFSTGSEKENSNTVAAAAILPAALGRLVIKLPNLQTELPDCTATSSPVRHSKKCTPELEPQAQAACNNVSGASVSPLKAYGEPFTPGKDQDDGLTEMTGEPTTSSARIPTESSREPNEGTTLNVAKEKTLQKIKFENNVTTIVIKNGNITRPYKTRVVVIEDLINQLKKETYDMRHSNTVDNNTDAACNPGSSARDNAAPPSPEMPTDEEIDVVNLPEGETINTSVKKCSTAVQVMRSKVEPSIDNVVTPTYKVQTAEDAVLKHLVKNPSITIRRVAQRVIIGANTELPPDNNWKFTCYPQNISDASRVELSITTKNACAGGNHVVTCMKADHGQKNKAAPSTVKLKELLEGCDSSTFFTSAVPTRFEPAVILNRITPKSTTSVFGHQTKCPETVNVASPVNDKQETRRAKAAAASTPCSPTKALMAPPFAPSSPGVRQTSKALDTGRKIFKSTRNASSSFKLEFGNTKRFMQKSILINKPKKKVYVPPEALQPQFTDSHLEELFKEDEDYHWSLNEMLNGSCCSDELWKVKEMDVLLAKYYLDDCAFNDETPLLADLITTSDVSQDLQAQFEKFEYPMGLELKHPFENLVKDI